MTTVTFGNGVTTIRNNAFYGCSLTSVTIPDSVTTIEPYAFENCYKLASVTFGKDSNLESIGNQAFSYCGFYENTAHLTIAIPDSVTTIGGYAFCNVAEITYSPKMTATGTPWGAKKVNGVAQ